MTARDQKVLLDRPRFRRENPMYDLKLKIWLERDGAFIISDGRARLLRRIKDSGSLAEAAREMGMSYRHAWGILHRIAQNADGQIVDSVRGGKEGGETTLTPLGEEILREFENKSRAILSQFEHEWKKPSVTADGIVTKDGSVLLVRRGNDPFKGSYALPGGFLDRGETLEHCVVREVREETGIRSEIIELVGIYSAADRDPRGHFVTAVYHLRPTGGALKAGDDAEHAEWVPMDRLPELAFDHGKVLRDFVSGHKAKGKK